MIFLALWKHFNKKRWLAWCGLRRTCLWPVRWQFLSLSTEVHLLCHISSSRVYLQWHFLDLAWPSNLHNVFKWAKVIIIYRASQRSWILLAVVWSPVGNLCTCSMGSLILSYSSPNLDKQYAGWVGWPFAVLHSEVIWKGPHQQVLQSWYCLCQTLGKNFFNGFWFVSRSCLI